MSNTSTKNESGSESTSVSASTSTRESSENRNHESNNTSTTTDAVSAFEPTNLVVRPEMTLEYVQSKAKYREFSTCSGRGKETAAVRGYNVERLAGAIFDFVAAPRGQSRKPWYDAFTMGDHDVALRIESKSCIYRYPSGSYGRFKIWKHHHDKIVEKAEERTRPKNRYIYFFLVYDIVEGITEEVGKLAVPVRQIDDVLDRWTVRDHPTMGERRARDISWNLLLKRLGVPKSVFREQPIVDLTDGLPSTNSDN